MRRVAVVFVLVRAAVCVAAEPGVPLTIPGSGSLIVPSPTVAELACYASHPMLEIFTDKRFYGSSLRFAGLPTPSLPGATDGFAPPIPRVVAEVPCSMTTLCHDTLLSASDTMNLVTAWGRVAILEPQASNEESCYSLSVVRSPISETRVYFSPAVSPCCCACNQREQDRLSAVPCLSPPQHKVRDVRAARPAFRSLRGIYRELARAGRRRGRGSRESGTGSPRCGFARGIK